MLSVPLAAPIELLLIEQKHVQEISGQLEQLKSVIFKIPAPTAVYRVNTHAASSLS